MTAGFFPSISYDPALNAFAHCAYRQKLAGERLAGDYTAAFVGTKGDQAWVQHLYGFERYWACNNMCWECKASKVVPGLLWTDVRPTAGWIATSGEYAEPRSSFVDVIGWHPSSVHKDLLHVLFVNGIGNFLTGSVLMECARQKLFPNGPNDTEESHLHQAFIEFRDWCDDCGVESTHDGFTKNSLHCQQKKDYPWLGGKGSDIKLVVLWLAQKLPQLAFSNLRATRVVISLATFIHIVGAAGVLLSDAEVTRLRRAGLTVVRGFVGLARAALRQRKCLYKVRPKLHGFHHMVLQLRRVNPSFFSCWSDEDFMGRIAKIASKTHRRAVSLRVLERYLFQLSQVMSACARGR